MIYDYINLNAKPTGSGIQPYAWVAPVRWFSLIQEPVRDSEYPGKNIIITDPHIFNNAAYGFRQVAAAPDKNLYENRSVGDRATQKKEHTLNVFIGGSYGRLHEALMIMQNEPFIILFKDADCPGGYTYQMGDKMDWAWLQSDFSTATSKDGAKGYTCTFRWVGESIFLYQPEPPVPVINPDFDPADFFYQHFKTV